MVQTFDRLTGPVVPAELEDALAVEHDLVALLLGLCRSKARGKREEKVCKV
jgi:hypothetical protein